MVCKSRAGSASIGVAAFCLLAAAATRADDLPTPGPGRAGEAEIRALGWSPTRLDAAVAFAGRLSTDTLLVVTNGRTVADLGDASRHYAVYSIRKALLSALVGQYVGSGPNQIDLDATLAALGVDDFPGRLTQLQKQATVRHLIKSISGINHAAAAEEGQRAEKARRLGRGENRPGTKWAYNNWDYNVLTTIFETRTGRSIAAAFATGIAKPAGMQDFSPPSVSYIAAPRVSRHRAAMFRMSGRDLARFGQIYLRGGRLNGARILPESWIDRITTEAVDTGKDGLRAGHGYLWWVPSQRTGLPAGTYWALGLGHQAVFVIPAWRTVIVHQADMSAFLQRFLERLRRGGVTAEAALEAVAMACLGRAARESEFCRNDRFILRREFERLVSMIVAARR